MNTKLISQLLIERSLTQKSLAESAGISATGLNQIIKGVVKPKTETIERIAAALGISTAMLMNPSSGSVHIQSGNIKNIMGNHNGMSEAPGGGTLFYGTGEIELLKSEVSSLRELLQSKEETIQTLRMLIDHYKKGEG